MSSTGEKEFYRIVGSKEEQSKLSEAVKLELRRALRRFDGRVADVLKKYNIQPR